MEMTGLPMVFAVWAGAGECITPEVVAAFQASCACGLGDLERIAREEAEARNFGLELARRYLTSHVVFELGAAERQGMELFLRYGRELPAQSPQPGVGRFDTPSRALFK